MISIIASRLPCQWICFPRVATPNGLHGGGSASSVCCPACGAQPPPSACSCALFFSAWATGWANWHLNCVFAKSKTSQRLRHPFPPRQLCVSLPRRDLPSAFLLGPFLGVAADIISHPPSSSTSQRKAKQPRQHRWALTRATAIPPPPHRRWKTRDHVARPSGAYPSLSAARRATSPTSTSAPPIRTASTQRATMSVVLSS